MANFVVSGLQFSSVRMANPSSSFFLGFVLLLERICHPCDYINCYKNCSFCHDLRENISTVILPKINGWLFCFEGDFDRCAQEISAALEFSFSRVENPCRVLYSNTGGRAHGTVWCSVDCSDWGPLWTLKLSIFISFFSWWKIAAVHANGILLKQIIGRVKVRDGKQSSCQENCTCLWEIFFLREFFLFFLRHLTDSSSSSLLP